MRMEKENEKNIIRTECEKELVNVGLIMVDCILKCFINQGK